MTVVDYVLGIVVFVVLIAFSIGWHELGHLIPAKLFHVRVSQYMIGFGPTIFSRKKGETEFGVKAIPLGGYIRMIGMYSPHASAKAPSKGWRARMASEAREASVEEIKENGGDDSRAFYPLSTPRKLVIMLGGPFMNLVLAFILAAIVVCGVGSQGPSTTIAEVVPCTAQLSDSNATCPTGAASSPAQAAGLRSGDKILSWNGVPTKSWDQLTQQIAGNGAKEASVVVERAGNDVTLQVTPFALKESGGTHYAVGVTSQTTTQRDSITQVPGVTWSQITGSAEVLGRMPVSVYQAAVAMVDKQAVSQTAQQNRPISIVGVARISGEISSDAANPLVSNPWQTRWGMWLSLGMSVNIALFLFNLIPLLPLDGGHAIGAVWEGIKRLAARLRSRARPLPADTARFMPVSYGVFGLIMLMAVVLILADIVNPVQLN